MEQIDPQEEGPAVAELEMGDLRLGAHAGEIAQSSLQSNWNVPPGAKDSGTNAPRPHICCWRR